ncbi:MAG: hypothetical protein QM765_51105 [Myxococcales bacterium]
MEKLLGRLQAATQRVRLAQQRLHLLQVAAQRLVGGRELLGGLGAAVGLGELGDDDRDLLAHLLDRLQGQDAVGEAAAVLHLAQRRQRRPLVAGDDLLDLDLDRAALALGGLDLRAGGHAPGVGERVRERRDQPVLDRAPQRPGAVHRLVARLRQRLHDGPVDVQAHAGAGQPAPRAQLVDH